MLDSITEKDIIKVIKKELLKLLELMPFFIQKTIKINNLNFNYYD